MYHILGEVFVFCATRKADNNTKNLRLQNKPRPHTAQPRRALWGNAGIWEWRGSVFVAGGALLLGRIFCLLGVFQIIRCEVDCVEKLHGDGTGESEPELGFRTFRKRRQPISQN